MATLWDLRQWIESRIPLWLVAVFIVIYLIVVFVRIQRYKRYAEIDKALERRRNSDKA